jgi:hypothetical protein
MSVGLVGAIVVTTFILQVEEPINSLTFVDGIAILDFVHAH